MQLDAHPPLMSTLDLGKVKDLIGALVRHCRFGEQTWLLNLVGIFSRPRWRIRTSGLKIRRCRQ